MSKTWLVISFAGFLVLTNFVTGLGQETPSMKEPARLIELDFSDVLALREQCLQLAVGEYAQNIFSLAEEAFREAVLLADKSDTIRAKDVVKEAEAAYRDAILIGFEEGLFRKAEIELESRTSRITREQYKEAKTILLKIRGESIGSLEFVRLVKRIKETIVPLCGNGNILPDLTVKLWNVPNSPITWTRPFPPINNEPTTISVLVKNIGIAPVDKSFSTNLYVDNKLVKTWTFSPVQEEEDPKHAKQPLNPGGTRIYEYEITFSGGTHTFRWVVDAKDEIPESDESKKSNELEAKAIWKAKADLPDLVVEDISTEDPLTVGQETNWKVKIRNVGKSDVTVPFMTSLKTSEGVQFGAWWVNSLAKGVSKTNKIKQYSVHEGKEDITAIVDAGNVVSESNEKNNLFVKKFTTSYVDLVVTNLVIKPQNPVVHKPVTISFTVKNNGPGDATKPFKVWVYPGKVMKSGLTHQPILLTFPKNKLPLKAGQSVDFSHKVGLRHATNYQAGVQVDFPDPNFVYKEKNTFNNSLVKNFYLKETYYVKVDKVVYEQCKTKAYVVLDRSGGYWKGDVWFFIALQPTALGGSKHMGDKYPSVGISVPRGSAHSKWIEKPILSHYNLTLTPYAIVGNKKIKSPAPPTAVNLFPKEQLEIHSISPKSMTRGTTGLVTLKGKALSGWNYIQPSIKNDLITINVKKYSYQEIVAEFSIAANAELGSRTITVSSQCAGKDGIRFRVVKPGSEQPTQPPKKNMPDLFIHSGWNKPTFAEPNKAFTFYFIGGNLGDADAPPSKAKVTLSGNGISKSTIIKISKKKAKQPFTKSWHFPNGLPYGTGYHIDVYLDYDNKINEYNENNNHITPVLTFNVW